jgi:fused signal recognition particle receptor
LISLTKGVAMVKTSFFEKIKVGLAKTRDVLTMDLDDLLSKKVIDKDLYDKLEELLIAADMGPQFTCDLIDDVKKRVSRHDLQNAEEIKKVLQ